MDENFMARSGKSLRKNIKSKYKCETLILNFIQLTEFRFVMILTAGYVN